jgi:spore coat protein U-like protein
VTSGNTDTVPYRLYRNAARSQAWGNQTGTNTPDPANGSGTAQSLTVYGRVPGLPNVRPDSYRDTVVVNVTY